MRGGDKIGCQRRKGRDRDKKKIIVKVEKPRKREKNIKERKRLGLRPKITIKPEDDKRAKTTTKKATIILENKSIIRDNKDGTDLT